MTRKDVIDYMGRYPRGARFFVVAVEDEDLAGHVAEQDMRRAHTKLNDIADEMRLWYEESGTFGTHMLRSLATLGLDLSKDGESALADDTGFILANEQHREESVK